MVGDYIDHNAVKPVSKVKPVIYLVGSLRNPVVPQVGGLLRPLGFDVFDDWHGVGPEADDHWQSYEKARGRSYGEALQGHAAKNIFRFDKTHIERADIGILVAPAGKSGHLEIGYMAGRGNVLRPKRENAGTAGNFRQRAARGAGAVGCDVSVLLSDFLLRR